MNTRRGRLPVIALGAAAVVVLGAGLRPPARADTRPAGPPQYLPLEAEWCLERDLAAESTLRPPCIQLEVPRTPRQYAWGLMQRPALGRLRGMWFRFEPPQAVSFWMHRTLTPLDMVFIREGRVIAIETNVQPCLRLPCPSYGPGEPADGVVELDAGEAARLGLKAGSPARVRWHAVPAAPARD
jgi:uncharacterized membrane protein (UPF0127 family)